MKLLGSLALTGVLLAGCAQEGSPQTPPAAQPPTHTTPPEAPATTSPAAAVPEILKFTATTVDGQPFDGASLAGRPTVLWFWAAWCTKCKGDADEVRELQKAVSGRVNVVGVAGLGSGGPGMTRFTGDYQLTGFPQLADDKGDVYRRFKVPSQHYYVVLDASGQEIHRGPLTVAQLRQKLA